MDFTRAHESEAKLVGICFGHQAITKALGGKVERMCRCQESISISDAYGFAAPRKKTTITSLLTALSSDCQLTPFWWWWYDQYGQTHFNRFRKHIKQHRGIGNLSKGCKAWFSWINRKNTEEGCILRHPSRIDITYKKITFRIGDRTLLFYLDLLYDMSLAESIKNDSFFYQVTEKFLLRSNSKTNFTTKEKTSRFSFNDLHKIFPYLYQYQGTLHYCIYYTELSTQWRDNS